MRWNSPFTLELTTEEPSITEYVVNVVNKNSNMSSINRVNITNYTTALTDCTVKYCFIVSAVNRLGEGEESSPACITLLDCMGETLFYEEKS